MKINVADIDNKLQKTIEIEDENILKFFYEKKIGYKMKADILGSEWENFFLKINGGQDKQGFPMKPAILTNRRIKMLLTKGTIGCKGYGFKKGERCKKTIRGSIVSPEIRLLNISVIRKMKNKNNLRSNLFLKTKRADKIRKKYSLSKGKNLIKCAIKQSSLDFSEKKMKYFKIQRTVTPLSIQRKRVILSKKKNKLTKKKTQIIQYGKILTHV